MNRVTIRYKKKKNGFLSIYLEFYPPIKLNDGSLQKFEFLNIEKHADPINEIQVEYNKEIDEVVESIRCQRYLDIVRNDYSFLAKKNMSESFLEYFKEKCAYHGVKYECSYYHFSKFCKGVCTFENISVSFCENFRNYILRSKCLHKRKKLSRNTASSYFNAFMSIVKLAHQDRILPMDIYSQVTPIKWDHSNYKEYLTKSEIKRLVQTPFEKYPKIKDACLFSIYTGLRRSDVLNLQWENLHLRFKKSPYMKLRIQKTGTMIRLPLADEAIRILGEPKKSGPVFGTITAQKINAHLPKWLKAAQINKHITFHSFRHTFAMMLLEKGVDIYAIANLLGHKSVTNTQVYARMSQKDIRKAIQKL